MCLSFISVLIKVQYKIIYTITNNILLQTRNKRLSV